MKKALIAAMILTMIGGALAAQEAIRPVREAVQANTPAETAFVEQKETIRASTETGSALLDKFIDNLSDMARGGTPDLLDKRLIEMMLVAKKARESNAIDAVFFYRFNRMLAVTKLVTVPDSTGILAPVLEDVLNDFVQDKLGSSGFRDEGGKGPKAINLVANALSTELIDLQIYLMTAKERGELQHKLQERMTGAPKK